MPEELNYLFFSHLIQYIVYMLDWASLGVNKSEKILANQSQAIQPSQTRSRPASSLFGLFSTSYRFVPGIPMLKHYIGFFWPEMWYLKAIIFCCFVCDDGIACGWSVSNFSYINARVFSDVSIVWRVIVNWRSNRDESPTNRSCNSRRNTSSWCRRWPTSFARLRTIAAVRKSCRNSWAASANFVSRIATCNNSSTIVIVCQLLFRLLLL